MRRYSIDGTQFLSAATHRASFSLVATCCFNFETDMSVFFIFWPIRSCPALISCFSCAAMPVAESVYFPADKKPFCRGHLHHVDEDATCCGLRLEIMSHASHLLQRPDEAAGENRHHVFFHIIVENDQAELETADSISLHVHVRTWRTVQCTRAAPAWATLVLWQRRSSGSEATGTRVTVSCS